MRRVTETRILLRPDDQRVRAFATIVLDDDLVIRDLRVMDTGSSRGLWVDLPSRPTTDHCPSCGRNNALSSRYCQWCGRPLTERAAPLDGRGRPRRYQSVVFPATSKCRAEIETAVLAAYRAEVEASRAPDYRPNYGRPLGGDQAARVETREEATCD